MMTTQVRSTANIMAGLLNARSFSARVKSTQMSCAAWANLPFS